MGNISFLYYVQTGSTGIAPLVLHSWMAVGLTDGVCSASLMSTISTISTIPLWA